MTSLNPCRRCHRKADCQIKRDTLAALKGLRISKANLRCKIPSQDFPVGARVTVQAFEMVDAGYSEESYRKCAISRGGVISAWKANKATVVLDKDDEIETPDGPPVAHLHAEPDRLTRADTPLVEMCACGGLSKARCQDGDYPSLKNGGNWYCQAAEQSDRSEVDAVAWP